MSDLPTTDETGRIGNRTRTAVLGTGALAGVLAFLVGYLVTWVTAGTRAASVTVTGPFGSGVPDWRAVLWVFFDGHFVGTRTPQVFGPDGALWGGGELVDTVSLLDVTYVYAIPPLVLAVAGAAVALHLRSETPRAGVQAGLTVGIGYLVAVVLALFVATQGGIAPSPLRALVVAGIVYPVAFGGLGGFVAVLVTTRTSGERSSPAA